MATCKWPTKPLSQVQVTVGETSMMATPERAYFDAAAVNEAVMAERERCAAVCDGVREAADHSARDGHRKAGAMASAALCAKLIMA